MTLREAFDALMFELCPMRPSEPDPLRMQYGPTAQFRRLQKQREAWAGPDAQTSTTVSTDHDLEETG